MISVLDEWFHVLKICQLLSTTATWHQPIICPRTKIITMENLHGKTPMKSCLVSFHFSLKWCPFSKARLVATKATKATPRPGHIAGATDDQRAVRGHLEVGTGDLATRRGPEPWYMMFWWLNGDSIGFFHGDIVGMNQWGWLVSSPLVRPHYITIQRTSKN